MHDEQGLDGDSVGEGFVPSPAMFGGPAPPPDKHQTIKVTLPRLAGAGGSLDEELTIHIEVQTSGHNVEVEASVEGPSVLENTEHKRVVGLISDLI